MLFPIKHENMRSGGPAPSALPGAVFSKSFLLVESATDKLSHSRFEGINSPKFGEIRSRDCLR